MRALRLHLATLAQCQRGLALIEFALCLPIFLFLLLGGLEITNLVMVHMRVNQVAITVADNAGRVRSGIDEANIAEVFAGVDVVSGSMDFANNGRVVLSSLQPNGLVGSDAGQMINWQRCYGELAVYPLYGTQDTGRANGELPGGMGPEGNMIAAADSTAVMFVEATYQYSPIFFDLLDLGVTQIHYESAFNVRERTNQNITNTQSLAVNTCPTPPPAI